MSEQTVAEMENKVETNAQEIQQNNTQVKVEEVASEENQQERDWRKFRESRQKEREAAAVDRQARLKAEQEAAALKAALEAVVNKPQANQYHQQQEDFEETEDQKIDRRVAEALAKREAEYEKKRQEEESVTFPSKLRTTFKDFDQICSSENLDYLEYHHPELASELASKPQGFDKWAKTYNAIKRYIPNLDNRKDIQKMEKNLQKPGSISSNNLSPPGQAVKSSYKELEAKRAERWTEMERMRKNVG